MQPDTTKELNLEVLPANRNPALAGDRELTEPNELSPAVIIVGTVIEPEEVAITFEPDG